MRQPQFLRSRHSSDLLTDIVLSDQILVDNNFTNAWDKNGIYTRLLEAQIIRPYCLPDNLTAAASSLWGSASAYLPTPTLLVYQPGRLTYQARPYLDGGRLLDS